MSIRQQYVWRFLLVSLLVAAGTAANVDAATTIATSGGQTFAVIKDGTTLLVTDPSGNLNVTGNITSNGSSVCTAANGLCASAVPYQSSAAGWTNTTLQTSTTLAVRINSSNATGSLVVRNNTSTHLFVNGSSGNVGIGTAAPNNTLTVKPSGGPVGATALFQDATASTGKTKVVIQAGAGDTWGDTQFNVLTNSGTSVFSADAVNGHVILNALTTPTTGGGLVYYTKVAGTTNGAGVTLTNNYIQRTYTSGNGQELLISGSSDVYGYAPTSGTGNYSMAEFRPRINQTGGANGITRGLYINPNIIAAADFRALDIASGNSYFGGDVGIGTTGPTAALHVNSSAAAGSLFIQNTTGSTHLFVNGSSGNVGIGTTAPTAALTVNSSAGAGSLLIQSTSGSTHLFVNGSSGTVGIGTTAPLATLHINNTDSASNYYGLYIDGTETYGIYLGTSADDNCYDAGAASACAVNDYAEMMEFSELPADGDIIIVDTAHSGLLRVANTPYAKGIAGIASKEPAMVIGSYGITIKGWDHNTTGPNGTYRYPLAIAGRKLLKATDENGEIQPGDLLVTSSERGKAMRCELQDTDDDDLVTVVKRLQENERCRNAAIGIAMSTQRPDGRVLALVGT